MKISRAIAFVAALAGVLSPAVVNAAQVAALHAAQVPVADQGDAERERGFRAGLGLVVVKLTGQRTALADPGVAQLLTRASGLIEQYNYLPALPARLSGSSAPTATAGAVVPRESGFLLDMHFSAAAVDAALRELNLPLWPAQRPELLLLASGGEAGSTAVLEVARRVLAERGIPVLEPLWDMEDRRAIGATEAGFDAERIAVLATRYLTNQWLALDPVEGNDPHGGRWRIGGNGALLSGTVAADSLAHWVENGIGDAVDQLAARLAYVPQAGTAALTLVIEEVHSYASYRTVLDTLEAMEFIRVLQVASLEAGHLKLALQLDGDPGLLWSALDGNPRFQAIVPATVTETVVQAPAIAAEPTAEVPAGAESTAQLAVQPKVEAAAQPVAERHYQWREL